jgi:ComF family protein
LRAAIHALKYRGKRRLAARLADELLAVAGVRDLLSADAVLVPVPLHPRRRRQRGFNQSALLARALGARTGLPVVEALRRRRDTDAQTGLSAAARRANVRGAFVARVPPALLRGRPVVMVDDVVTTGATATACARALAGAGADEIRLLTLARA